MSTAAPRPGRPGGAVVPAQRRRHRRPEHWLLAQLPSWMREDDFFARFVSMFEVIATTHLDHVDQLEHVFDLNVAPPEMVRALGRCMGVDLLDPGLDETVQREVLIEMGLLARLQGTKRRLTRVLELVTRERVEVIDSGAVVIDGGAPPAPPHVRIRVESTGWMDEDDLVALVRRELPASVTFELWLGDRPLWPAPEPAPIRRVTHGLPPVRHADRPRRAARWTPTSSARHATSPSSGPPVRSVSRRWRRSRRSIPTPDSVPAGLTKRPPSRVRAATRSPNST